LYKVSLLVIKYILTWVRLLLPVYIQKDLAMWGKPSYISRSYFKQKPVSEVAEPANL